jgi:hypothetical protein
MASELLQRNVAKEKSDKKSEKHGYDERRFT